LVVGGLMGILAYCMMGMQSLRQHRYWTSAAAAIAVALFAWAIATGISLWQGTSRGFTWAKLLFALQIPTFTAAHFTYEFSTFLSLRVMVGNTTHNFGGNLGSSSTLLYSPQPLGWMLGVNCVAILVSWYLRKASRDRVDRADTIVTA